MLLLTVIIATYNRCQLLPRALNSILDQKINHASDFEVIVVDNNSTDQTTQVLNSFLPQFKDKLRCFSESQKGKSFAINRAILESKGDILVFTDDDIIADESWLENIIKCFRQYDCDGIGGRILAEYPPHTPEWVKKNADLLAGTIVFYDHGDGVKPYSQSMYQFLGANFAFKKSLFQEYGYFRTDIGPGICALGEDTEIVHRFFKAGKKLYYCGNAVIRHPVEDYRMNLKYIGGWNVDLGRYRFIVDEQAKIDPNLVYWFGIPRYLIAKMIRALVPLSMNIFNKRGFLITWIDFCRNWGKAKEMRKVYLKNYA